MQRRTLVLIAVFGAFVAAMGRVTMSFVRDEYAQLSGLIGWLGIDEFTGEEASAAQQAQVVALDRFTGAWKLDGSGVVALEWSASPHVSGLRVTRKRGSGGAALSARESTTSLVVGTIRMGFGHHRIAYAACSWGLAAREFEGVYFHDLLSIESPEADLIRDTDKLYRRSSKLATELGGPFEWFHGMMTSSGDATSLRTTALVAARLAPLVRGLPRGCPFVATHSLVALAVALANVTQNLANLVIDNHPQWFVASPRALNLVQGPRNYLGFLAKNNNDAGSSDYRLAGHWVPKEIVDNVPEDCTRRVRRARANAKPPLRILVPVGGAGAQRAFITSLVRALAPMIKAGRVSLVLNAGDHADIRDALAKELDASFGAYAVVATIDQARDLAASMRRSDLEDPPVTLMAFVDYFAAVAATDVLVRSVDLLACKPSELAFYSVPKLMIRRVGDHEAFSANRANELADGTEEVRTVAAAVNYVNLFATNPDPLVLMNNAIIRNTKNGIYDGCKFAIRTLANNVSSSADDDDDDDDDDL
ncbi:hypothetical protein CTAYLR_001819 [Chrysophaeum taylorii]|uniref:Uncharacterized protein n=1 Tax=Chrysophaeum taylorii TaxID=2483200 RepID=A0AAD7U873_9STRA|nr:hypothetical protein CTAYLR_001819 [Chrysophaeum taylorii]